AGVTLVGGHSIDDAEPKYGMAVTGVVDPRRIWCNAGARVGDVLVLTKPIGVGAITQGIKAGQTPDALAKRAIEVMARLNRDAYEAALDFTVHAATDVTGYGLLGHALEMARGAAGGLRLRCADVPVLDGARDLVARGIYPGGTKKNLAAVEPHTRFTAALDAADRLLLADAVTSGGLLLAVPAAEAEAFGRALRRRGTLSWAVIGEVAGDLPSGIIEVV
ncbi:MAG TPA: selenide, water dikinase SelD, partial [Bacillota bacterium]